MLVEDALGLYIPLLSLSPKKFENVKDFIAEVQANDREATTPPKPAPLNT
jgi:hypothetical protein